MCLFPALILMIKLRFLNKVCLMHIMWGKKRDRMNCLPHWAITLWTKPKHKSPPCVCFYVCDHAVTAGRVYDRNGEGAPGDLRPFSSSLVPWAAGVSAFLLWVIIWVREEWLHCQTARVEERRVYMKWYHSDLTASTNHNCCLPHETDDSDHSENPKRKGFLISRLLLVCLKIIDDNAWRKMSLQGQTF